MSGKFKLITLLLFVIIFSNNKSYSQFDSRYSLELGLTSMSIIGNNAARSPMWYNDQNGNHTYGGSLSGSHSGGTIRLNIAIDSAGKFSVPIGINYTFLEGFYSYPTIDTSSIMRRRYLINYHFVVYDPDISIGINYNLHTFPIAHAKLYMGMDAVLSFITDPKMTREIIDVTSDTSFTLKDSKTSAVRLGGVLRLGINGRLNKDWNADISCSAGILNLIGRENNRGELLTPMKEVISTGYIESKETLVYVFHFVMAVQYRL